VCEAKGRGREREMGRRRSSPASELLEWVQRQSMRLKICLGAALALCALVALKLTVSNNHYFFIGSESVHAAGIVVLVYKLTTKKTCSGISIYIHTCMSSYYDIYMSSHTS
jgi:ER lumen protein retaining receptor